MKADQVIFKTNHIPSLHSGSYTLVAEQKTHLNEKLQEANYVVEQELEVNGNRFDLNPLDVRTVFPPEGSTGDHSNVLPHICLNRSTIPWEWYAFDQEGDLTEKQEQVPWLCLLVLCEDDQPGGILAKSDLDAVFTDNADKLWNELITAGWISKGYPDADRIILSTSSRTKKELSGDFHEQEDAINKFLDSKRSQGTKTLNELKKGSVDINDMTYSKGFTRLDFEDETSMASYLDLDNALLDRLLPKSPKPTNPEKPFELTQLAHVRQKTDHKGEGADHAFIIGNRLPIPGEKCTVHLLSLEGRYDKQGNFIYGMNEATPITEIPKDQTKLIRVISLKNWSFHCVDPDKSLIGSLKNIQLRDEDVNSHTLRLPASSDFNDNIKHYLEQSYVPVPHKMRKGSQTISWYRGPLIATGSSALKIDPKKEFKDEIVNNADELMGFDSEINMFNTAQSAAWELGRMLMLSEKELAQELFQWKRNQKQQLHKAEQLVIMPHLPFHDQEEPEMEMPVKLGKWLDDLRLLEHIPFNYLIPDERLLPKESLRFFQVDEGWIEALLDGVFSIGNVPYKDTFVKDKTVPIPGLSGMLLRSDVVSGWPDLLVDGYSQTPSVDNIDEDLSDLRLPLLRMEKITDTILLCIFEGLVETVDIHLKPEALHFGFNRPIYPNPLPKVFTLPSGYKTEAAFLADNKIFMDFNKDLRDVDGTEYQKNGQSMPLNIAWRNGGVHRIIDPIQMTMNFKTAMEEEFKTVFIKGMNPDAADFALQMIEGVSKVRYTIGNYKASGSSKFGNLVQLHQRFKDNPIVKDIYTVVEVTPIEGAEEYRFMLTPSSGFEDALYESSKDNKFQFEGITRGSKLMNTTYSVDVTVMKNGKWSESSIEAGTIKLNCPYLDAGGHLHSELDLKKEYAAEDWIYARKIPLVGAYKFTFMELSNPANTYTKETVENRFKIKSLSGGKLVPGKYQVNVQLKYGNVWDDEGASQIIIIK